MEGVGVAKIAQIMDLCNFLPDMELKGHRIMISDVNRPALQLSGYFKPVSYTHLTLPTT